MKIAIVSHLRFPIAEPFAGGLEAHTHQLATKLTERGHDVTVFGAPGTQGNFKVIRCNNAAHTLPDELEREAGIAKGYNAIYDRIEASNFDLIHNNSLNHVPMIRAGKARTPSVQVLHSPLLPYCKAAAATIREQGDPRLIAVSAMTAEEWRPSFPVQNVVPNGVDLMRWRYSSRPVPNMVAYAGRIVPEKGVHLAIQAAKLANKQMLIAGPVADQDRAYYDEQIAPLLDEQRRYVGHLTRQETAHLMSNAECFVFSSTWNEPFGLVLAESLACGTPIAGFDVGAAREVLDDQTSVLVPKGDINALAEAMTTATQLDRAACRRKAAAEFSVDTMIDRYEDIYRDEFRRHTTKRTPVLVGVESLTMATPSTGTPLRSQV